MEPKSPVQKGRRDANVSGPEHVTRKSTCLNVEHGLAAADRGKVERESALASLVYPFRGASETAAGDVVS